MVLVVGRHERNSRRYKIYTTRCSFSDPVLSNITRTVVVWQCTRTRRFPSDQEPVYTGSTLVTSTGTPGYRQVK